VYCNVVATVYCNVVATVYCNVVATVFCNVDKGSCVTKIPVRVFFLSLSESI
jgi:hypothetical protein